MKKILSCSIAILIVGASSFALSTFTGEIWKESNYTTGGSDTLSIVNKGGNAYEITAGGATKIIRVAGANSGWTTSSTATDEGLGYNISLISTGIQAINGATIIVNAKDKLSFTGNSSFNGNYGNLVVYGELSSPAARFDTTATNGNSSIYVAKGGIFSATNLNQSMNATGYTNTVTIDGTFNYHSGAASATTGARQSGIGYNGGSNGILQFIVNPTGSINVSAGGYTATGLGAYFSMTNLGGTESVAVYLDGGNMNFTAGLVNTNNNNVGILTDITVVAGKDNGIIFRDASSAINVNVGSLAQANADKAALDLWWSEGKISSTLDSSLFNFEVTVTQNGTKYDVVASMVAVPEASEVAAILGLAALGFAAYRRRK